MKGTAVKVKLTFEYWDLGGHLGINMCQSICRLHADAAGGYMWTAWGMLRPTVLHTSLLPGESLQLQCARFSKNRVLNETNYSWGFFSIEICKRKGTACSSKTRRSRAQSPLFCVPPGHCPQVIKFCFCVWITIRLHHTHPWCVY